MSLMLKERCQPCCREAIARAAALWAVLEYFINESAYNFAYSLMWMLAWWHQAGIDKRLDCANNRHNYFDK
jgi:hypothetical protein